MASPSKLNERSIRVRGIFQTTKPEAHTHSDRSQFVIPLINRFEKMPRFTIARAKRFIKLALDSPLYQHIGEPIDDKTIVRVKSIAQYERAMKSKAWDDVSHNTLNHHTARIIDIYGETWFQNRNNDCVEMIWEEIDKTPFQRRLNRAWKLAELPDEIEPFINAKRWAYNYFSSLAYDHALGFGSDDSFEKRYVEHWFLNGHLPCGWKGAVPKEPKFKPGIRTWSGMSLDRAVGPGQLVVY